MHVQLYSSKSPVHAWGWWIYVWKEQRSLLIKYPILSVSQVEWQWHIWPIHQPAKLWFAYFPRITQPVAELCLGVPMGKGWLGAPLIKKCLRKVQEIEVRNTPEPCGVGSRDSVKCPGWGQGAKPLLSISMQKQYFARKLRPIYVRLLRKRHCFKQFFHASFLHTTCYARNWRVCGTWYTNCQNLSWQPWFDACFVVFWGVIMGPMLKDFLCEIPQFGRHMSYILLLCKVPPSAVIEGAPK